MTDQHQSDEISRIRERYRSLAVEWAEARDEPKVANKLFRQHHNFYKEVRTTPAGQQAIVGLLGDVLDPVRLLAATHSLTWQPEAACEVLADLEAAGNLYSIDAEFTLKAFRGGRLDLDW